MFKQAACVLIPVLGGVAGCSAPTTDTVSGQPPSIVETGARIYGGNCNSCHQQDGHGVPGLYPSLAGSPVLLGDTRALTRWVVKGERPSSMPEGRYPTKMPQFGWLKAVDAAALFTFLRSSFGNDGASVDAAEVSRALGD